MLSEQILGRKHSGRLSLTTKARKKCKRDECNDCKQNDVSLKTCPVTTRSQTKSQDNTPKENDPSWLENWDLNDLKIWQNDDVNIKQILTWKEASGTKPPWSDVQSQSKEIKSLWNQWDNLHIQNSVLYRQTVQNDNKSEYQLVAPTRLKREIMLQLHNSITAGHMGATRTYYAIKQRFYWPDYKQDILTWCRNCEFCAKRKSGSGKSKAPLHQYHVGDRNEKISLDIIGPLPETSNNNIYILSVIDHFTKFAEAYAMPDQKAVTIADILVSQWISRYGVPNQIHTDQGRQFESDLFQKICDFLGTKKSHSLPYRPQSQGLVEGLNRTIQDMLAIIINENKDNWDEMLPYVMMAYRSTHQASTGETPNKMYFGENINLPIDCMYPCPKPISPECPHEYVLWLQETMAKAHAAARKSQKLNAERQKHNYDKGIKLEIFQPNQKVWRWYLPSAKQKLGQKWIGPYTVLRKINDLHYEIQSENNKTIKVHVDHLKPYHEN